MKQKRRFSVYLVIALAAVATACGGDAADSFVVQIDDSGVRMADLSAALDTRVEIEGDAKRDDILDEELDRMVAEQVTWNRARALGVAVSDDELDSRLRDVHGPDFATNDPPYREMVRREMAGERAAILDLADRLQVPEEAIASYFEEHREQYQRPARIQLRQIVVQDEARARSLKKELDGGADFAALAQAHSAAPEGSQGGLLAPFAKGELPEVFDRAFDLDLDEVSGVLESPYGFHMFLLVARFPPHVPELGDVHEQIEAELRTRRLAELKRSWLRDLRREASIKVNERVLEKLR